jgi:DNA-binding Xre family transcriptional regulator
MIKPSDIQIDDLPFVSLEDRSRLPETPCIYFAIDSQGVIQYIGRSVNPRSRWGSHHRYKQISAMGEARIAYLTIDAPELLAEIEEALIDRFDPPLNDSDIPLDENSSRRHTNIKWNLAYLMLDRDVKTGDLAQATGLHPSTISKLKSSRQMPKRLDRDTLDLLCNALRCQPGDLMIYEKPEMDAKKSND